MINVYKWPPTQEAFVRLSIKHQQNLLSCSRLTHLKKSTKNETC